MRGRVAEMRWRNWAMGIRSQGTNKERAEGLQALGKIGQGGGESGTGHKALLEMKGG